MTAHDTILFFRGNQMSKIKARKKCTLCRARSVIVYYKAHNAQIITINNSDMYDVILN